MSYSLTIKAEKDLASIYDRGADLFGLLQASDYGDGIERVFEFLAEYPRSAREREDIMPVVRAYPYKAHAIVYVLEGDDVLIVRIRHAHEDWQSNPF